MQHLTEANVKRLTFLKARKKQIEAEHDVLVANLKSELPADEEVIVGDTILVKRSSKSTSFNKSGFTLKAVAKWGMEAKALINAHHSSSPSESLYLKK